VLSAVVLLAGNISLRPAGKGAPEQLAQQQKTDCADARSAQPRSRKTVASAWPGNRTFIRHVHRSTGGLGELTSRTHCDRHAAGTIALKGGRIDDLALSSFARRLTRNRRRSSLLSLRGPAIRSMRNSAGRAPPDKRQATDLRNRLEAVAPEGSASVTR